MLKKIKGFLFENTAVRQTIVKNTFWLTVSNFGGRLIKAVVIVYAARVLGTSGWGVFSYAITLAAFVSLVVDPGVNATLMRESSKADEEDRRTIFSTALVVKLFLLVFGIGLIVFIAPYFSTLPGAKALLPIVAMVLTFDTFREFLSSLIRGKEKMEWEAGIFLLTNFAIIAFGFIFLAISPTPKSFAWGYAAGTAIGAIAATIVLRDYFKKIFSRFSFRLIPPMLTSAWPFAITGTLGLLLTNTDILIISWMRTASDVGIYSAGIRIIQILYLIPSIFQLSTMPLFARLANRENDKFRIVFERTISFIFLVSIPLAVGGAILGTQILHLLFGQSYESGGLAFKILMITMLVDYPATIISAAIFAYNHQKSLIITSAIGGIANVAFDLILIPKFGITGSAVATLIAQTLSNWYLWRTMNKLNRFEILPRLKRVFAAAVFMLLLTVTLFFLHVNVIINIIASALLYVALLKTFREPLLEEIIAVLPTSSAAKTPVA